MKNYYYFLLFTFILFSISTSAQSTGRYDTVITFMGQNRTLSIYVPVNYSPSNSYRLMVGLHGLGDNSVNYSNAVINSFNWKNIFPNTIFVFPDGGSDQNKDFYAPAGDEEIIQEAINLAKNTYSIDTNNIILQGFSLGGRSALKYGLEHPEKFKGLLLNTPAIQGWMDATNDSMASLIYNYANASEIPIYITVGKQDQLYDYILNNVQNLLKKNDALIEFRSIAGLGHTLPAQQFITPSIEFFDAPTGADYDLDLFEINMVQRSCDTIVSPSIFVQNRGSVPVTSIQLNYQLGSNNGSHTWTGLLDSFEHTEIIIPGLDGDYGDITFTANIGSVNGSNTDTVTINNTLTRDVSLVEEGAPLNITEGFENNMNGWIFEDSKTLFEWYRDTDVKKTGVASVAAFNTILLFYTEGNVESIQSPVVDLSSATNPILTFDIAYNYHRYTPPYFQSNTDFADTLEILVSIDCGATFQSIYKKGGADLATASAPILNPLSLQQVWFYPTASEWRSDTLPLTAFSNTKEAIVRFSYISAMGGSINLDNIGISDHINVGIEELLSEKISVYPNPASTYINVVTENINVEDLMIFDISGRMVHHKKLNNKSSKTSNVINVDELPVGIYQVVLQGKDKRSVQKLIITR